MNNSLISSLLLAFAFVCATPLQASEQKCTPGYVGPLLQKGSWQSGGKFLGAGRSYTVVKNGVSVTDAHLGTVAVQGFQIQSTQWDRAKNSCMVTGLDGTRLELIPDPKK